MILLVLAVALVCSSGMFSALGPALLSGSGDEAVASAPNRTVVPASGVTDTSLRIAEEDVSYLNRIFRERTHETAYCGFVDEGRLRPWLADTVRASDTSVEFRITNCLNGDEQGELTAVVHTHSNGITHLSQRDVRTLRNSSFEVMCVQGGQITAKVNHGTEKFRCYRLTGPESTRVREIPVVATSE